jgi:hypothetical protein
MRTTILFAALTVGLLILTSCNRSTYVTSYKSTESRDFEPRQGVVVTPLVADMKVLSQTAVKDSAVFNVCVSTIPNNEIKSWISEYKKEVMSMMLKKYDADAIVAPLTDVTTTRDGYMKINISGYLAKYVNFRNATTADTWMVPLYNVIDKNSAEPLNSLNTKISVTK